jgi:hypothetical protein
MPCWSRKLGQSVWGTHQVTTCVLAGTEQIAGVLLIHTWHDTGVKSSSRSNRARWSASLASVLTQSPLGRWSFYGATTSHRIPAAVKSRASPNPLGPAS